MNARATPAGSSEFQETVSKAMVALYAEFYGHERTTAPGELIDRAADALFFLDAAPRTAQHGSRP